MLLDISNASPEQQTLPITWRLAALPDLTGRDTVRKDEQELSEKTKSTNKYIEAER